MFCRCVTCHSAWRRCSADISWRTTLTGPWQSASCAIRSSPGTTTSKCTWRMSTEKQRARGDCGSTGWKYLISQIKFSVVLHEASMAFTYCIHRWIDSRNVVIKDTYTWNMEDIRESIAELKHRLYICNFFVILFRYCCGNLDKQNSSYVWSASRAAVSAHRANEMSDISLLVFSDF